MVQPVITSIQLYVREPRFSAVAFQILPSPICTHHYLKLTMQFSWQLHTQPILAVTSEMASLADLSCHRRETPASVHTKHSSPSPPCDLPEPAPNKATFLRLRHLPSLGGSCRCFVSRAFPSEQFAFACLVHPTIRAIRSPLLLPEL